MMSSWDALHRDLGQAVRNLQRAPGFAITCVLTLSLGIALTAAMFSVLQAVLFRGPPIPDAERAVYIERRVQPQGTQGVTLDEYHAYVEQQRSFEQLAAIISGNVTLSGADGAERVASAYVSANALAFLGGTPALGRTFTDEETRGLGEPVVVIGHALWQDRGITLGAQLRIEGVQRTVVGVMPEGFAMPDRQEVWLPLAARDMFSPSLLGKLREGVSVEAATAELMLLERALAPEREVTIRIRPFVDYLLGDGPRALLFTMFGAVALVLLIACVNVANLLFARMTARTRELAVRRALGASRARLVMLALSESWVLSVLGVLLGGVIAHALATLFLNALARRTPQWMGAGLDGATFAFVAVLSVVTAVAAGLLPALRASRIELRGALAEGGRGSSAVRTNRVTRALVMFEVALSCGLLVAAGLTIRSIVAVRNADLGFDAAPVLVAGTPLPQGRYSDAELSAAYARMQQSLDARAEFTAAAIATGVPGVGGGDWRVEAEGRLVERPEDRPMIGYNAVHGDWLSTLDTEMLRGRALDERDTGSSEAVAIVTEAFARRFFPGEDAVGRRIRVGSMEDEPHWRTIVGIIPNLHLGEIAEGSERQTRETIIVPLTQVPRTFWLWVMVRTRTDAASSVTALRQAVNAFDPDVAVIEPRMLPRAIREDTWFFGLFGGAFIVFGGAALMLAAIGLYSVLAFSVSQRTREMGVRVALGATPARIQLMILRQGLVQVAIGMLGGVLLASMLSRLLSVILYGVQPNDPVVYGGVIGVLVVSALVACVVPARRATAVMPGEVLGR